MQKTVETAPHGSRLAISLRPVPMCEPPFDDELEPTVWATAHQLALDWPAVPPIERPTRPDGRHPHEPTFATQHGRVAAHPGNRNSQPGHPRELAAPPHGHPGEQAPTQPPVTPARRPVVAGASADAKLAVRRFVHMCLEVLNGYRPPAHLRRLSLPTEAAAVVAQGHAGAHRVAELRKRCQSPGRRPPRRTPPAAVISLRLCEPRPGAVEAAVALVTADRTWAMALRLELHQDAWSATTLRLI